MAETTNGAATQVMIRTTKPEPRYEGPAESDEQAQSALRGVILAKVMEMSSISLGAAAAAIDALEDGLGNGDDEYPEETFVAHLLLKHNWRRLDPEIVEADLADYRSNLKKQQRRSGEFKLSRAQQARKELHRALLLDVRSSFRSWSMDANDGDLLLMQNILETAEANQSPSDECASLLTGIGEALDCGAAVFCPPGLVGHVTEYIRELTTAKGGGFDAAA